MRRSTPAGSIPRARRSRRLSRLIFANQISIETPAQLTQITSKYAQAHGISPFLSPSTPQGNLQAWSRGDYALASASA